MPFIADRNSKKPVAERATTPFSAIRNPKVRKTCHRESFWGPWSDEVPDTEVLGCKNEIFDLRAASNLQHLTARIGWLLWPLYLESHKLQDMVSLSGKASEKNLVQQTIASRWWCVVTVRSLQTISRYAALWFWDLVCSAAVRSLRVLGRSPVCRSFC